jgi:hypothetical protein
MPNWCSNSLSISHTDPAKMQVVREALADNRLFSTLIPCPQELTDTVAGSVSEDKKQEHEAQIASNIEKYGYPDWYAFQNANWGTKWDICEANIASDEGYLIHLSFDTAWSPPINGYERLVAMGFSILAMYYESGMGFCGIWENGRDEYYDIEEPDNQEWIEANIPEEILDNMGIEAWEDQDDYVATLG